jgi:predicted MPP superfamily phosphohydrolase
MDMYRFGVMRAVVMVPVAVGIQSYLAHRISHGLDLSDAATELTFGVAWVAGCMIGVTYGLVAYTGRPWVTLWQRVAYLWGGFSAPTWLFLVLRDLLWAMTAWWVTWSDGWVWWSTALAWGLGITIGLAALAGARRQAAIHEVDIVLPGLPKALEGFRIAHVSDVHVGPTVGRGRAQEIADQVAALSPDLIVCTGDMADGRADALADAMAPLTSMTCPHGVWYVTGNHEYYAGGLAWRDHFAAAGWHTLHNSHELLEVDGARILFAGIPDPFGRPIEGDVAPDLDTALEGAPEADVRVLLAHQPGVAAAAAARGFDLQLSGHTHGGQIFPFVYIARAVHAHAEGWHRVGPMQLFVSRGATWWGPPMRLVAWHELGLVVLRSG